MEGYPQGAGVVRARGRPPVEDLHPPVPPPAPERRRRQARRQVRVRPHELRPQLRRGAGQRLGRRHRPAGFLRQVRHPARVGQVVDGLGGPQRRAAPRRLRPLRRTPIWRSEEGEEFVSWSADYSFSDAISVRYLCFDIIYYVMIGGTKIKAAIGLRGVIFCFSKGTKGLVV